MAILPPNMITTNLNAPTRTQYYRYSMRIRVYATRNFVGLHLLQVLIHSHLKILLPPEVLTMMMHQMSR